MTETKTVRGVVEYKDAPDQATEKATSAWLSNRDREDTAVERKRAARELGRAEKVRVGVLSRPDRVRNTR